MESGAYGASLAGGSFDCVAFLKQPQTIVRVLSWVFAIVVFATITGEGYINTSAENAKCMFNENDGACSYAVFVGVVAFLSCVFFLVLDAYFPQISNAKERKYIVTADLGFSGLWTFLWFICFCYLANQWSHTNKTDNVIVDAARAVVAFSFFSIITWGLLVFFAVRRYREGVTEFSQNYTDPANDHTTPYPPYATTVPQGYQQSPFSSNTEQQGDGGYQPPAY
ncbi:synaptogyrin-2-like [Scleropages formosus]|uniref:Synaptogyrin n=1 Tax=Scleropages formosus TaxID=113540 RepID=A0A0P7UL86_SCLFO|nr:synaptogyrin-2-like [Scleropages formosus]KPP60235.1 synaptogyrin-2-like [Scleropages formosus]